MSNARAVVKTLVIAMMMFFALAFGVRAQFKQSTPKPDYKLSSDQTHNKFSSQIKPVLTVSSGAVIEAQLQEASAGQLKITSTAADLANVSFDPIHPLTGPVYVKDAEVGDVLSVTLHKITLGDWGWTAVFPGFGFLNDEFTKPGIKTYSFEQSKLKPFKSNKSAIAFTDRINVPLAPFPGVMGVAPATTDMLSTVPPRANGGNMDDPFILEGAVVYFPVLVKGALFSIGDPHAAQGLGEVCGTAIEAPMTVIYEVRVIKGRSWIKEPQYETADFYAVTGFGKSLDEAAKKATQYMLAYLVNVHALSDYDAYMLCSIAGDLHIAEVVDAPNMLVTMHMSKDVLGIRDAEFGNSAPVQGE